MVEPVQTLAIPTALEALAIAVGAISGAMHARRRGMDVMGILVVSLCAALGGGVIRDILLVSGPPAVLTSPMFLVFAMVGAVAGWGFSWLFRRATVLLQVIDGLFIGVWVVLGATTALGDGLGFGAVVLVAVITAAGGGVLRDLVCGQQVSLLLPGQWQSATPALLGALIFVGLFWVGVDPITAEVVCILIASGMRLLSALYDIRTPMPMDVGKVFSGS